MDDKVAESLGRLELATQGHRQISTEYVCRVNFRGELV